MVSVAHTNRGERPDDVGLAGLVQDCGFHAWLM